MDLCSSYIYIFAIWSCEQMLKRSHTYTPIEVPLVNKSHDSIHIIHNIKAEKKMMRKNRGKSSSLGRL